MKWFQWDSPEEKLVVSLKMKNDKNLSSLADAVFLLNDKYLFEKLMNYVTKKQIYQSE